MIDPNLSDWSDQDLLTVTEARERLLHEIATVQSEIAETDPASQTALRRRLAALEKRLQQ